MELQLVATTRILGPKSEEVLFSGILTNSSDFVRYRGSRSANLGIIPHQPKISSSSSITPSKCTKHLPIPPYQHSEELAREGTGRRKTKTYRNEAKVSNAHSRR